MKKFLIKALIIFLAVVVVGTGIATAIFFHNFKFVSKTSYDSTAVLERVQTLSELNTVEMYFNEIIDYSDAKYFKQFKIPFTTKKVLFTAKARVKAGVDLSKLTVESIKVKKDYVEIILPKPTITSKEILESDAYDEQDGAFNKVTTDDTLKLLDEFTVQLEQQAINSGIIEKAEENAKLAVQNLLQIMEFKEMDIKFEE